MGKAFKGNWKSTLAYWFGLRSIKETRSQALQLLVELYRQQVAFDWRSTPLSQTPLDRLTESEAQQLIAEIRQKLAEHTRVTLLVREEEIVRARGMGVLVE